MITTSAVCVALFFGGWHIPWIDLVWPATWGDTRSADPSVTTSLLVCIVRAIAFFTKTLLIIGVFMWVRWSLPRFRFDQIMNLAWRALIPISLFMLLATAVTVWALGPEGRFDLRINGKMALVLIIVNGVVLVATMLTSTLIPAAPDTNRKIRVPGSRFEKTALPAGVSA
jgi:NADH-quinone oxidoreductase subunit H